MTVRIVTFYEFKDMSQVGDLEDLRRQIKTSMVDFGIKGTVILAAEGYNATVCGPDEAVAAFLIICGSILGSTIGGSSSFHDTWPFRRSEVKVRAEIVTLAHDAPAPTADDSRVSPTEWNQIISDRSTFVLDARNDYEYRTGTFAGAVNPGTQRFSELPKFVAENLDPTRHPRIAMFCTGGVRCEKFAPYLKWLGFETVYQLKGGILAYLDQVPAEDSLWQGECFVFDDRVSVDEALRKGTTNDLSQTGPSRGLERAE